MEALVSLLPAALTALHVYFPEWDISTVGTLSLQLLSVQLRSRFGPLLISWPLWNQEVVKGLEPATLHTISPGLPTTRCVSLSFLMKLGGINLSIAKKEQLLYFGHC